MIQGRWKARIIGACLLAALGGCQGAPDSRREVDPLLGGTPIPSSSASTGRLPGFSGDVPPLQTGRTSTSPVALTIGPAGADPERTAPAAPGPAVKTPTVTIQVPRPLGQAPAASPGVVPVSATTPAPSASTVSTSFEQIQQALKARGVTEQHLDTTGKPDEWCFTCAIPNANNPLLRRNYETRRVGPGGLEAMRAVLEDIEQDR